MSFGVEQAGNATPSWVAKAVAAATLFLQLLPPVLEQSAIVTDHVHQVLDLVFKIANVVIVVAAIFIGNSPKTE